MKRFVLILGAMLGLAFSASPARADCCGSWSYSGYQPWYNPLRYWWNHCQTPEERRLQKFWHDYYSALSCYYGSLEHLDWVGYYKNHGLQINGQNCGYPGGACPQGGCGQAPGCNLGPINYAPVFVHPTIQWAVPTNNGASPVCPNY